jgi:hypothetical protein
MSPSRWLAWLVALVWFAWAAAIDTQLRAGSGVPDWLPDIGIALFVAWSVRMEVRDLWILACLAALARASFSVEPPIALLAAHLAVVMAVRVGRKSFDLARPLGRGLVAGVVVAAWIVWAWIVLVARHGEGAAPTQAMLLSAALGTATLTLILGGSLAKLPGAGLLLERRYRG